MFLFPQIASSDLKAAQEHVEYLIGRGEGEIISLAKWDERRLAYEIKGNRRGLYFLTYFKATGEGAIEIERQVNLSEQLLRAMILKADLVPADVIAAADAREQLAQEIVERALLRRPKLWLPPSPAGKTLKPNKPSLPRPKRPSRPSLMPRRLKKKMPKKPPKPPSVAPATPDPVPFATLMTQVVSL